MRKASQGASPSGFFALLIEVSAEEPVVIKH
jgi:hypothetical protein